MQKHDGDCTIYSLTCNGHPWDGICTCGYGAYVKRRTGSTKEMMSKERWDQQPKITTDNINAAFDMLERIEAESRVVNGSGAFYDKDTGEQIA